MFLSLQNGFIFPAHYESSSWANGLLDKLARPKYDSFSFPTRYGSCRTGLFFPLGSGLVFPAHFWSNSWTNGLMDTHVRPNGSVLLLQPVMGPTIGPMACWTSVFFQIGERFSPPAHYGSSSWNNGLVGKLVIPSWKRFSPPAHYGSNSWTNGLLDRLVLPNWGTV